MADTPPYQYIIASGLIIPDTSEILTIVQTEWKQAFGQDLIVTTDTPQGVMISAETTARTNAVNNNAAVANQINPNISGGIFLDAILALMGVERNADEPTVVTGVALTGIPFTSIPVGSLAATADGDIFQSVSTVALDASGNATVNFQSIFSGAIPCAPATLTHVVRGPLGWETVTNANAGLVGSTSQSDQSARAFRLNTLSYNGISLAEAITSALYVVPGVTSLAFRENFNAVEMGALISITNGATLAGQIWGLTTTGNITVGTTVMNFALSAQDLPTPNPWPVAKYSTTGNVALTGLGTQGGGDWSSAMTAGDIVLLKDQTTATQNGIYVVESGAWIRQAYNINGAVIIGSNDGISMKRNSIYACVDGGTDLDVAAAMLENKSSGCGWNGNTTVNLIEPASGQSYPVQLDRPAIVPILIKVTASNVTQQAVIDSILDYAAGNLNGLQGFIVGADVSPFELAGAIMAENPGSYVSSVTISLGTGSPSYSTTPIPIGLNQIAQTLSSYIDVTVA